MLSDDRATHIGLYQTHLGCRLSKHTLAIMSPPPGQCFSVKIHAQRCSTDISFAPSCANETGTTEILSEMQWDLQIRDALELQ